MRHATRTRTVAATCLSGRRPSRAATCRAKRIKLAVATCLLATGGTLGVTTGLRAADGTFGTAGGTFSAAGGILGATGQVHGTGGQDERGAAAIALRFRQLDGVKRVLMVAAHPDDEDTSLLAALARGSGVETAYLSLTRGEGGQNLIGPRLHEGLGIIRTGELEAARALDGGTQFFSRAFDFGYSKTLEETLSHWPMDEVLRDVVFVMRSFRPHVVVSIFSGTSRDGHGHHQASGVLTLEAFEAAGDPTRFPELAAHGVTPWAPAKLYRSARFSPADATVRVSTGTFDPVLGRSYFQLAMRSRSQHRSQDMGSAEYMGPWDAPLQLLASRVGEEDGDGVFAGVDTTIFGQLPNPLPPEWPADSRARLDTYRQVVADSRSRLTTLRTQESAVGLLDAAGILEALVEEAPPGEARRTLASRLALVRETALAAAGVVVETRVGRSLLAPGESTVVDVIVWNGGSLPLRHVAPRLALPPGWTAEPTAESAMAAPRSFFRRPGAPDTPEDGHVPPSAIARWSWTTNIPPDARPSAPYYLEAERDGWMYQWPDDPARWARPFDPSPVQAVVALTIAPPDRPERRVEVRREGDYVGVDPASGEYREPVLVVPALDVEAHPQVRVWPAEAADAREIAVVLANTSSTRRFGSVRIVAPDGWRIEPDSASFALEPSAGPQGTRRSFAFQATPTGPVQEGRHDFRAVAVDQHGALFDDDYDIVDHPHVRRAALFRPASSVVSAFPVVADASLRIGYVMGSGDGGPEALRQMGAMVDLLGPERVRDGDFGEYDVLVLGVRAYETRPDLVAANESVLDFARQGGTVVVQYNRFGYPLGGFAPYPVQMNRPHDRVTDETAPVAIAMPGAPVFTTPNAIGPADFEGWVQERGLYFLSEWDDRFVPLLETADPGEAPKRGALLVAPVGEGLYVYTGIAFFRQFPAGVPGAYRLFANLVSLKPEEWRRAMARRPIGG